ncbi:MAG: hypothetical protein IJW55_07480 [Clostridia bacterium]|nr:hypothetical protein [Clostridia bacterium]
MRQIIYTTERVNSKPAVLKDGVLYVMPHYNLAVHRCMCGCGEEVITPIDENGGRSPGFWGWTADGINVSLHPSVGNFQFKCRSHYFLKNGKVQWV